MGPLPDMRWQLASPVDPPCGKSAIRLMKDQFIDDLARASKLDSEAFQLDDAKSSVVMRCKTVSRLVVGLQYKLPFCTQRHAMRRRATPENADAPRTESHVDAVTSGKAREDNVSDHGLKRCRKTDDVALAVGQEGNREPVRQQTVEVLWQFEGLIVTMRHGGDHPAPRPVQGSILLLYRHDAVGRMFIVAGIGRKIVRRAGIFGWRAFSRAFLSTCIWTRACSRCSRKRWRQSIGSRPRRRSMMYQVSVPRTALGLRLVKIAIPTPKSGTRVIR